jgi:hypothetical protein
MEEKAEAGAEEKAGVEDNREVISRREPTRIVG